VFDLFVVHRSVRVEGRGHGGKNALEKHASILNLKIEPQKKQTTRLKNRFS
jgi:hypothetical protein